MTAPEPKPRRPRLFDPAEGVKEIRIKMPADMMDRLRVLSKKSCLEPAVYLRTLLATHLNKNKA